MKYFEDFQGNLNFLPVGIGVLSMIDISETSVFDWTIIEQMDVIDSEVFRKYLEEVSQDIDQPLYTVFQEPLVLDLGVFWESTVQDLKLS